MDKKIETLHRLCEALMEELEEYSKKIDKSDKMSVGDLEAVDKLSHALKSVKTTIAMMESEDGEEGYSGRYMPPWYGGMAYESGRGGQGGGSSNRGGSYNRGGNSNRGGMSSARGGRGNNPTGRNQYSRDGGYSYAEEELEMALRDAMNAAPDEHVREKLQRILDEV